jgi:spore coat protein CotH
MRARHPTVLTLAAHLAIVLAIAPSVLCGQSTPSPAKGSVPGEKFFTNGFVHSFEVLIAPKNVAILRTTPREYVPATVRANGHVYTNVGVHLKGVATFRPIDDEPSLTLNFSKFSREQRFHGLRKIHLNNGKEDPSFLCEALSAEMFAAAGMPVARAVHGRLTLNGRNLGVYVIKEGFTEEFLARYFENTRGNLYDSGFRHDIDYPLERLLGKRPDNWKDLRQLAAAAQQPDLRERWQELARNLDTNSFASYLAMQVLISNWDGYALYKNNYRIYNDPESQRLYFMPHGMDQTFSRPTAVLMPSRWDGFVARAFMQTPEGRRLYQQQLGNFYTNHWRTEALVQRVDELAALIRPIFAEQSPIVAAEHEREVAALRRRIQQRGEFLAQQFATTNWMNVRTTSPVRRPAPFEPLIR